MMQQRYPLHSIEQAHSEAHKYVHCARRTGLNRFVTAMLLSGAVFAGKAEAQLGGVSVNVVPRSQIGHELTFYTYPLGMQGHTVGSVFPIAHQVVWNVSRLGLRAGSGIILTTNDSVCRGITFGGGASWQFKKYDPIQESFIWKPYTQLVVGVTYTEAEDGLGTWRQWDMPTALGLGWVWPAEQFNILPWIVPRLHLRVIRDLFDGGDKKVKVGGGLSAGIEAYKANCPPAQRCLHGWGIQLAFEALIIDDVRPGDSGVELTASLAFLWKFATLAQ